MAFLFSLCCCLISIVLTGCADVGPSVQPELNGKYFLGQDFNEQRLNELQPGYTEDRVIQTLGVKPNEYIRYTDGSYHCRWSYTLNTSTKQLEVSFDNSKKLVRLISYVNNFITKPSFLIKNVDRFQPGVTTEAEAVQLLGSEPSTHVYNADGSYIVVWQDQAIDRLKEPPQEVNSVFDKNRKFVHLKTISVPLKTNGNRNFDDQKLAQLKPGMTDIETMQLLNAVPVSIVMEDDLRYLVWEYATPSGGKNLKLVYDSNSKFVRIFIYANSLVAHLSSHTIDVSKLRTSSTTETEVTQLLESEPWVRVYYADGTHTALWITNDGVHSLLFSNAGTYLRKIDDHLAAGTYHLLLGLKDFALAKEAQAKTVVAKANPAAESSESGILGILDQIGNFAQAIGNVAEQIDAVQNGRHSTSSSTTHQATTSTTGNPFATSDSLLSNVQRETNESFRLIEACHQGDQNACAKQAELQQNLDRSVRTAERYSRMQDRLHYVEDSNRAAQQRMDAVDEWGRAKDDQRYYGEAAADAAQRGEDPDEYNRKMIEAGTRADEANQAAGGGLGR